MCHLAMSQPVALTSRRLFFPLFWPLDQFSLGVFSIVGSYTVNIVGGVVQRLPSTGNNKDHDSGPQVGTVSIYTYNLTEKNHAELITISRSGSVNLVPMNPSLRTFSCYVHLWTRLDVNAWKEPLTCVSSRPLCPVNDKYTRRHSNPLIYA